MGLGNPSSPQGHARTKGKAENELGREGGREEGKSRRGGDSRLDRPTDRPTGFRWNTNDVTNRTAAAHLSAEREGRTTTTTTRLTVLKDERLLFNCVGGLTSLIVPLHARGVNSIDQLTFQLSFPNTVGHPIELAKLN